MTTVAAVDCGTNSLRLLISSVVALDEDEVQLVDVERRMEVVRLGQDVDQTGVFSPDALDRTFATLQEYADLMASHGVPMGGDDNAVRMVATSATRDVANRDEFVAGVRSIIGVEPEVITGDDEAELSFVGATAELAETGDDGFARPFLVVDIGGGSTEFVLGHSGDEETGVVRAARSVNIGCVRMTERHLTSDPPTREQVAAATADIDAAIEEVCTTVPLAEAATVVCVAGTATTVAGIAGDLPEYDPGRIHHTRVSAGRVREITDELLAIEHDQRAAIGVMHPGRVDVIGAGALVLQRVLTRIGAAEFVASEHDILDGLAWSLCLGGVSAD